MTQPGHESARADALQALVRSAETHASAAHLERAVRRWSRDVASPSDAVALAGAARTGLGGGARRRELLDRATQLAVAAVAERQVAAALVDPLTGLATRARMQDEGEHLLALSRRTGKPVAVVVLDVDGLKRLNDEQGHAAGDAALAAVGQAVRRHLRSADRAFRWGGDEFVLLLPGSSAQDARLVVDRIQRSCATSVSVGIATEGELPEGADLAALLDTADADLYARRGAVRAALAPDRRRRPSPGVRNAALLGLLAAAAGVVGWTGATVAGVTHTAHPGGTATTSAAPPRLPAVVVLRAPAPTAARAAAPARPTARTTVVARHVETAPPPTVAPVLLPHVAVPVPLPTSIPAAPPPVPDTGGLVGGVLDTVKGVLGALL